MHQARYGPTLMRSWTSTSKTVQKSNFFYQVPKILKRFWPQIIMAICMLVSAPLTTACEARLIDRPGWPSRRQPSCQRVTAPMARSRPSSH